jgi:hypothetical protein
MAALEIRKRWILSAWSSMLGGSLPFWGTTAQVRNPEGWTLISQDSLWWYEITGKTTLISILTGAVSSSGGAAWVMGQSVTTEMKGIRKCLGENHGISCLGENHGISSARVPRLQFRRSANQRSVV